MKNQSFKKIFQSFGKVFRSKEKKKSMVLDHQTLREMIRGIVTTRKDEIACEDKLVIQKILSTHNKKVQDAVYYTYIERLNQKEIQKITGQSPATIRRNLNHFKKSMHYRRK